MWFFKKKTTESSVGVWLVSAATLALKCAWLELMPMRGLASTTWLIDDSFIEMKVARNVALGGGFSLDGVHPTTGAPFLWIYLTSLNHLLFGQDAAIRATLMESALFGALAAIVIFYLARKLLHDRRIAWTAFLLCTFTANAFFNAMNGMDTAFFTLFVLLAIAAFFQVGKPAKWSPFAWGCVTGLMAGITVMTRGDGLFVIFALFCVGAYQWWVAPKQERKNRMHALLGMLLIAGLCFAFFMGWQLVQTGSPLPGNQVGRRGLALALHNFSFDHFSLPQYVQIVVWNIFQLENLIGIASGGALLCLVAFVSGSLQKPLKALGAVTVIYLGIFFALLVGYQWYFADLHGLRYINPSIHLFFLFVAALLWQLPIEKWKTLAVTTLTLCIVVLAGYKHYQMCSRLPWAPYMSYVGTPDPAQNAVFWGTMDWMNANLKPGTLVGIRDYGRASMFTNVRIQDIAGNIAPDAAEALDNGTLDAYLKDRGVEYLLIPSLEQRSDKLYQYLHSHLHLQLVKGAPVSPTQGLYKIMW